MLKAEHRLLRKTGTHACASIRARVGERMQRESRQQHYCEKRITMCKSAGVTKSCDDQHGCLLEVVRNWSTVNLPRVTGEVLVALATRANLSVGVSMCL
jgi:hypothetical protein